MKRNLPLILIASSFIAVALVVVMVWPRGEKDERVWRVATPEDLIGSWEPFSASYRNTPFFERLWDSMVMRVNRWRWGGSTMSLLRR